ncbi:hypothetical protein TNCT_120831 [Trichonephila clavata]|uniref:Mos1 transposase HTH domain-containing protein n=1 Tax=Trichonephila clavata TaxID=2740835 RepID=A0A8X6LVI3_TRICU|nr:hypothetical protein TNCT_120831 [Trichonephila clavata]
MDVPKEEQRGVLRFLAAESVSQKEISRRMTVVYGAHCLSLTTVKRWSKRFREGHGSYKVDSKLGPKPPYNPSDTIVQVDELV